MQFEQYIKKNTLNTERVDGTSPCVPDGLFTSCCQCHRMILTDDLYQNHMVCPVCQSYQRMDAHTRIIELVDPGTFEEWDTGIREQNPCKCDGYLKKVKQLKESTGLDEAVVTGKGKINDQDVVIGVCDTRFLMGSMGRVVGEKITRAVERATNEGLPVILFTCSGGARMQEGIISLMQMEKTSAALRRLDQAGNLYISVLTDPTTGGVTASFAMLGDIILAEPGALVGFAGPRVIKQTIGQELPEGFQRAEFLLKHGLIDRIVERKDMKATLGFLLRIHRNAADSHMHQYKSYLDQIYAKKIDEKTMRKESDQEKSNTLAAWDKVMVARDKNRPTTIDFIQMLTKDFYELHGDRAYADDGAVVGGLALFGRQPVTIIGHQKGKSTKENVYRNFGMPYPEGYRKALRLMKQAEKFHRPILLLVDTPGAYCGVGAEERGQGEAIARNLFEMSTLKVPILTIVTGEGGSGGALALAVADEVWMLENAVYSVLSPEGYASILWKDATKAKQAAKVMHITAIELKKLGVIEKIIPEFPVLCESNNNRVTLYLKRQIAEFLCNYERMDVEEMMENRYQRFRKY